MLKLVVVIECTNYQSKLLLILLEKLSKKDYSVSSLT